MKHISFAHDDEKRYAQACKAATKEKYSAQLIQVFSGILEKDTIKKLLKKLHKDFPKAIIIGATTAGEILDAQIHDHSIVISLSLFRTSSLKVVYTEQISYESGQKVAKDIFEENTKAAIILGEGTHLQEYGSFLEGVRFKHEEVIISGGLAGDNFQHKGSWIFHNKELYDRGAVAVSFSSKELMAKNHYNLNWEPIGKVFTITKIEGNRLKTINDINAIEFFKKYLGSKVFENNGVNLGDIQLLFQEGGILVSRAPMGFDDQSIILAAPILEGQKVQFGFANSASIVGSSVAIAKELDNSLSEAIYVYSCVARKRLLGNVLQKEMRSFDAVAPSTGFFTYGEFYSTKKNNAILNCTTTILALSEKTKSASKKDHKLVDFDQNVLENVTFSALTHFIKQTSLELEANVKLMEEYKSVVDASSLVSKTNTKGMITYVNDKFAKVSQYTREELLGKSHSIVNDPNADPAIFKDLWHTISSGETWHGIFSNRAKDGSIYHVEAVIMPLFDEAGELKEYIAIRQDITKEFLERKKNEAKEKLIKAIFDNQDNIVIFANKDKGMLSVNQKFFDYFEYENFETFKIKHSCICDLFLKEEGYISKEDMPEWSDFISKDTSKDFKVKMRSKKGSIHTFNVKVTQISDDYIINLNDITNLEQALVKAYASEQSKSMFLANMSHEIRTPLNGILGFTDVLAKQSLEAETKRYVEIIHKSGETLLSIVNDILDFSKLESGELSLYETESNLFEELEASVSTFASLSKSKKINYYTYIDTRLPKLLKCDTQRIKQVMNNLISNAIKFTSQNGEVTVSVELKSVEDAKARIGFSVRDSGIGISKDKLKTIFQAFSQADGSISREFGGTGLGLSISNQFLNMMGSKIEVTSEISKGSEFFFELSLEVVDQSFAVAKNFNIENLYISLLKTSEGAECGVNEIVHQYLDSWNCNYKEIHTIEELEPKTQVLIVCAKLFEKESWIMFMQQHPDIQIIYIEGVDEVQELQDPNFHLIRQPMTGSALFDILISLVGAKRGEKPMKNIQSEQVNFQANVLVAEDNETNQMLISLLLQERGISTKIVENGQKALDEIEKNDIYDLIFMDINMPVLDGIEATKRLRAKGYSKPIVSLSANVIESDTQSFRDAGMDNTLNKPIIADELDKVLLEFLPKKLTQDKEEELDVVDISLIAQKIGFNEDTILKLLGSLESSLNKYLEELESKGFSRTLVHTIRGGTGNMRLEKVYEFTSRLEERFDTLNEDEKEHCKGILQKHIRNILEQIAKINK